MATFSLNQKRQPVCTPQRRRGFTTQALPSIGFGWMEGTRPPPPHGYPSSKPVVV